MLNYCHRRIAHRLLKIVGLRGRILPLRSGRHKILDSPTNFHNELCTRIRNAKRRVSLAALYVGAEGKRRELELLKAIEDSSVGVKVLMDANRGTRPVNNSLSTCSAEAVDKVASQLHLYRIPGQLRQQLPTPLNEVAGVFHIKAYVTDDHLILSGANLSEEYLTDRQDRYISFRDPGLVDFYADMVDILTNSARPYHENVTNEKCEANTDMFHRLGQLMIPTENEIELVNSAASDERIDGEISAYAIPTFFAPRMILPFASDTQQLLSLLNVSADESCRVRLASAYLNPTLPLLRALNNQHQTTLLTAGPVSHSFGPKPGVKRRGDWVPKVFQSIAHDIQNQYKHFNFQWYERPGWTFHGKGLWILSPSGSLVAAMVGSGNYGHRSEILDVESNCILIFPNETSPLQEQLLEEWDRLCEHTTEGSVESSSTSPSTSIVRAGAPFIQQFF